MTKALTWVVGAGGLLGSNVARQSARSGLLHTPRSPIPWGTPATRQHLARATSEFAEAAAGRPWQVAWCAGAGVTGTTREELAAEVAEFDHFVSGLERRGLSLGAGAVFLASSGGALYAGAAHPPFDESTQPVSISPYGDAKLAMEKSLASHAGAGGLRVAIGRISNLYGPGQNLSKPQGLLSQIVRSHLLRRPVRVFVSLDTLRDYLYAPDCAGLVLDLLDATREGTPPGRVVTKVLASQRAVTIAAILAELRRLLRRPPELVYVDSPAARYQVRDLRLRSVVLPHLDARTLTTLPAGLRATIDEMTIQLQAGRLS